MLQMRGYQWTSYDFWKGATEGLPVKPGGMGSEHIGGTGPLTTDEMKVLLRTSRAYVATGTQPASYVLNFIEAMMTGIPVVSVGPDWMCILPYGHLLLEMHELAPLYANDPADAHAHLERMIREPEYAAEIGAEGRRRAIGLFGMSTIAAQWQHFLAGYEVGEAMFTEKIGVAA
jgi:glycosyltransferase involved in cell wall biosynthesis